MNSGNHKFGRGGGRGAGAAKRRVFNPQAAPRISSSSSSGRLSLGGGGSCRNLPQSLSAPISETFSLVGRESLSFASIIRLAPDLLEEIKRVEAQGGAAKIKFDPNPNNPLGNVIDVGGKEFRFTWSHETGGLCDIYEERQTGEDDNGLLVESGCAWRKLNVQRVLDESAKKRVKMLSEEAERNLKSRKSKLLDPSNASMRSQMKALTAAEASPWKFKHNNCKKRNFEPSEVGLPPKSVRKSGFPSSGTTQGRHSCSPLPSPQNQSSSLASPSMRGNVTETVAVAENTTHIQSRIKENPMPAKKDLTYRASERLKEAEAHRDNQIEGAKDIQNSLVIPLKENPKGMSIKIATYEPSGVYILKPGLELESQKRPSSDSGSSPPEDSHQLYVTENNLGPAPAPAACFPLKSPPESLVSEPNLVEKIDGSQHFSVLFGDDDLHDNIEGRAGTSRENGSGNDSSDSGSRSRSRSPVGTASGSGCDSENNSSSRSKEGSDVEIDILNDDDNEPKKLHDTQNGLSREPIPWSMSEAGPLRVGNLGDQEGYASEDIDKDFLGDNEAELVSVSRVPVKSTEKFKSISPDHERSQPYGIADMRNEPEEHSGSLTRSKGTCDEKQDVEPETNYEKNSEEGRKLHTMGNSSRLQSGSSSKDGVRDELREPLPEEYVVTKKQFERAGLFKQSDAKASAFGCHNSDLKGRPAGKPTVDTGSPSLANSIAGGPKNSDKWSEKTSREPFAKDTNGTSRHANDRRKDVSSIEGRSDKRKRSGSLFDEDVSYSKYEKEEPELKGPIKNFSQYKEYVQEYSEKYESYSSLNNVVESYMIQFQKLGMDLDSAKVRDMERYYNILAQLRESYRQCGARHKRRKKAFIVLHEELKHLKQRIKDFALEYTRDSS